MSASNVFLADSPARLAVEIVAGKRAVVVLGRLQGSGLVARHVCAEAPPRVDYELTDLGRTLIEPIRTLSRWAEAHGEAVLDAQDRAQPG